MTEDMGEKTASQCRLPRGHPGDGCPQLGPLAGQKHETPRGRIPGRSIPEHVPEEYARPGRPSGLSRVQKIGQDHRHYLRLCITTAWQKLNEHYTKLGESPLFSAAIILHSALGMKYLEMNWESEEQLVWVRDARTGLLRYFERWYRESHPKSRTINN